MNLLFCAFTVAALYMNCAIHHTHAVERKIASENEITKYLERLKDKGYNPQVKPDSSSGSDSPVDVLVSMYLIDVHKIDDKSMDYQVQFFFRQRWNDSRLAFPETSSLPEVRIQDSNLIWKPDFFFVAEKEGIQNQITTPNVFVRISPNGSVFYSQRLTETFHCRMDFTKFPHDSQRCNFSFESYGFQRHEITPKWTHDVQRDEQIISFPFKLVDMDWDVSDVTVLSSKYRRLDVSLLFQRSTGFYISRLYIPYVILVALSWISFWMPSKMIALRLTLLLAILYIMIDIKSGINVHIPAAPYTKASDVWISVCQSLVFAAFLEFIAVRVLVKHKEKLQNSLAKSDPEAQSVLASDDKSKISQSTASACAVAARLTRNLISVRIDKLCRAMFPVLFFLFNFIYWVAYCA